MKWGFNEFFIIFAGLAFLLALVVPFLPGTWGERREQKKHRHQH